MLLKLFHSHCFIILSQTLFLWILRSVTRHCFSEFGSVKKYVKKVAKSWLFNQISFEVCQNFPVSRRAEVLWSQIVWRVE